MDKNYKYCGEGGGCSHCSLLIETTSVLLCCRVNITVSIVRHSEGTRAAGRNKTENDSPIKHAEHKRLHGSFEQKFILV